jgi:hypothetical protein
MAVTFTNGVASNREVYLGTRQLIDLLNGAPSFLRLYQNPFVPTPGTNRLTFIECNFTGYLPVLLTGFLPLPSKQLDGFFASQVPGCTFTNSGFLDTVIAGYYVSSGTDWFLAGAFDSPYTLVAGSDLVLSLTWQGLDLSLALS